MKAPQSVERPGGVSQQLDPRYTQINVLFPAREVELPSAEKFKAFPPEAQKAILAAFEREQAERLSWLKTQQKNDHALNLQDQRQYFLLRLSGTLAGALLTLSTIVLGAWLVRGGAAAAGVAMMIAAAAGLVGTAIYGHRALGSQKTKEAKSKPEEEG